MADDERPPEMTPWGEKYEESEPIPGFTFVHTGRHGGLYLTPDQRKDIPDVIKPHSAHEDGTWWEEDNAWSLPVVYLLSQRSSLSDEEKDFLEQAHEMAFGARAPRSNPGRLPEGDPWSFLLRVPPGDGDVRDQAPHGNQSFGRRPNASSHREDRPNCLHGHSPSVRGMQGWPCQPSWRGRDS